MELLLEINPNIDEIVKEQNELDADANLEETKSVVKQVKFSDEDVFDAPKKPKGKPKPKPKPKPSKPKPSVYMEVEEPQEPQEPHIPSPRPITSQEPPTLPLTYSQRKKAEKEEKKAEEKRIKNEEREKRNFETAERNREKARQRYWREKERKDKLKQTEKEEVPKAIVEQTTKKLNNFQKQDITKKVNNDMDFATFSSYMMKYEEMKTHITKQKEEEMKKEKQSQPRQSPFPDNYPTHLLYGNRNRRKQNIYF
jgi:hypothetical protein